MNEYSPENENRRNRPLKAKKWHCSAAFSICSVYELPTSNRQLRTCQNLTFLEVYGSAPLPQIFEKVSGFLKSYMVRPSAWAKNLNYKSGTSYEGFYLNFITLLIRQMTH
jgi:hypothetical protein